MSTYTRTGDKGETSVLGGKRVSKADPKIHLYGEIDELNSMIGAILSRYQISNIKNQKYPLRSEASKLKIKNELIEIQKDLFEIGLVLAGEGRSDSTYLKKKTEDMEKLIDKMTEELPKIKNFILPGGGEIGSKLHLIRAVCRRVERNLVEKETLDETILMYFNRLSDLLFTMARFINYKEGKKEIIWRKSR